MVRRSLLTAAFVLGAVTLAPAQSPSAKSGIPEGFTPLFDGKELKGWKATGKAEQWAAEGGHIVCKGGGGGWLLTEKEYSNFEFRCEYKWSKEGGNSGVSLRTPNTGDPAYVGMEIQLIDDEGWEKVHKSKLAPFQHTGSIYDVQPSKKQANKPIGEWNLFEVSCVGRKVKITQNGEVLTDANLDDYEAKVAKHPGLKREKGHVGFQSYNVKVEFRNIAIKEVK